MRISELLARLEALKAAHGDLQVGYMEYDRQDDAYWRESQPALLDIKERIQYYRYIDDAPEDQFVICL